MKDCHGALVVPCLRHAHPAVVLVLALFATACGDDSAPVKLVVSEGSGLPAPEEPVGTAGVFTVQFGQFNGVYTFLEDRRFAGVHFVSGALVAGHPRGTLSESNSTESMEPIRWSNFIDDAEQVGAQEPSPRFGRTFKGNSLNVKISGSMGTFSTTTNQQRPYSKSDARSLYHTPLAMSEVAGAYTGSVRTVGLDAPLTKASDFVVAEDGTFTTIAGDCAYAGTLSQHGATGIFEAEATATGDRCRFTVPLSGIVTPLEIDEGNPKFAFQLESAHGEYTAVFIVDKQ